MRLEYIKDVLGNNYPGVKFNTELIQPFLDEMKLHLSEKDFEEYCKLQQDRDNGYYHMTAINVMEYNSLIKKHGMDKITTAFQQWTEIEIHPKLMGIGSASKNGNCCFFIVVKCQEIDTLREAWGLDPKDLHVTLGFKFKDVHGVPKNVILNKPNPFLNILKEKFIENENWNFIRKIENYKSASNIDIIPYSLEKSNLKVAIGDERLQIGYLEDDRKLWIMASWVDKGEVTPLSTNEILGILKNG